MGGGLFSCFSKCNNASNGERGAPWKENPNIASITTSIDAVSKSSTNSASSASFKKRTPSKVSSCFTSFP